MKKMLAALCLFFTLFLSVSAHADYFSGNQGSDAVNASGQSIANQYKIKPVTTGESNSRMNGAGTARSNFGTNLFNQRDGSDASNPLFFKPSPNDSSVQLLGLVFGNVGDVLNGQGVPLLSQLFGIFNSALIGLGVIIITYLVFKGVIDTAAHGEFLGKQTNSVWVPMRVVIGILLLIPKKGGYCIAQILMMHIILMGVGAADTVWDGALDYFQNGGGLVPADYTSKTHQEEITLFGIFKIPGTQHAVTNSAAENDAASKLNLKKLSADAQVMVGNVFQSLVCIQAASLDGKGPVPVLPQVEKDGLGYNFNGYVWTNGDPKAKPTPIFCGSVSWKNYVPGESSADDKKWAGSEPAMKIVVARLFTYAKMLVDTSKASSSSLGLLVSKESLRSLPEGALRSILQSLFNKGIISDYTWMSPFWNKSYIELMPPMVRMADIPAPVQLLLKQNLAKKDGDALNLDPERQKKLYGLIGGNFVEQVANQYIGSLRDVRTSLPRTGESNQFMDNARNVGWAFAGAYVHDIISLNNQASDVGIPTSTPPPLLSDTSIPEAIAANVQFAISYLQSLAQTQKNPDLGLSPQTGDPYAVVGDMIRKAKPDISTKDFNNILQDLKSGRTEGDKYKTLVKVMGVKNDSKYNPIIAAAEGANRVIKETADRAKAQADSGGTLTVSLLPINPGGHGTVTYKTTSLKIFKCSASDKLKMGLTIFAGVIAGVVVPGVGGALVGGIAAGAGSVGYCSHNVKVAVPNDSTVDVLYNKINESMDFLLNNAEKQPLLALQSFGEALLYTQGDIIKNVGELNRKKMEITKNSAWKNVALSFVPIVGSGLSQLGNAKLEAELSILTSYQGFLIATAGALMVPVAMLAVYMPLLPYMLFAVGVLGWLLTVFEAMVAAPILALGVIHPEGRHDFFGKSEPAVGLIVNVFIKPMLMVIGLIAALLIADAIILFVTMGFRVAVISTFFSGGSTAIDPQKHITQAALFAVLFLFIYMSLVVALLTKSFQLIYVIPDKVLRWIEGFQAGTDQGEGQVMQETKQQYSQDVGAAQQAGSKGMEASVQMNDAQNKQTQQSMAAYGGMTKAALSSVGADAEAAKEMATKAGGAAMG